MTKAMRWLWDQRRNLLRFALAHHPTCSVFREDVVLLPLGRRRVPLCAGCVAFWPALALGFPVAVAVAVRTQTPSLALVLAGGVLASVQLASYAGWARRRATKLALKGLFGMAGAMVAAGVVLSDVPTAARVGILVGLGLAASGMQTWRMRKTTAICDACPWRRDWEHCPGFAPLNGYRPGIVPEAGGALPSPWPWQA